MATGASMLDEGFSGRAIEATACGSGTYIKFLSANDTGATGAHQSGILLSLSAVSMVFGEIPSSAIEKRGIRVTWQDDTATDSVFTWYASKRELRLTRLGRNFPYLNPDMTGALFVFTQLTCDEYTAYLLNTEDEIDAYLAAFNLGPQDAGRMVRSGGPAVVLSEHEEIERFVSGFGVAEGAEFPASTDISDAARRIQELVHDRAEQVRTNPDAKLVEYTRVEYAIFRELERQAYGDRISRGFRDVDSFVELANRVLNRRKSRAGRSLEHHLGAIFDANRLVFDTQVRTEGGKRPDFVFPSAAAYHDPLFPAEDLVILAAKTTCKDRWRQILNEADRNRNGVHYLVTLQQGNSDRQLEEMASERVQLVVPKQYHGFYPRPYRQGIWSLGDFISFVRKKESAA